MTTDPAPSSPRITTTQATRLSCAETWAGTAKTTGLIQLPGLVAWVHSVPAGLSDAGGDVHYLSVCPSCIVSRVALADVSGHGTAVAALGRTLRELMQRHLQALEQVPLMRDLNEEVRETMNEVNYATMIAIGWHGRRGLLVATNAGHPPPLWYRAARDEWRWLETTRTSVTTRLAGIPLGLLADIQYDRVVVRPRSGDLIVLYSDGVSEATNPAAEELGRDGLMNLVRGLDHSNAEIFGGLLTAALRRYRDGTDAADDETVIVLQPVTPLRGTSERRRSPGIVATDAS